MFRDMEKDFVVMGPFTKAATCAVLAVAGALALSLWGLTPRPRLLGGSLAPLPRRCPFPPMLPSRSGWRCLIRWQSDAVRPAAGAVPGMSEWMLRPCAPAARNEYALAREPSPSLPSWQGLAAFDLPRCRSTTAPAPWCRSG